METETTLPGMLTVPGELLPPVPRRRARSPLQLVVGIVLLLLALATVWAVWG